LSSTSPRLERAAALLDQTAPGWESRIDPLQLDMSNASFCILGQVYGSYYTGLAMLDGDAERAPGRYGFMTWGGETFGVLTAKWRTFLAERRAKRAA
jgi:hypothetical protein